MSHDPHSALALKLFGVVNRDTRARAKVINYQRAYSGGEINVSKVSGSYPAADLPIKDD